MKPAPDMRTLRFWAYVNGSWVKLSLHPGDTVTHIVAGPTDEGYNREIDAWTHAGDRVEHDSYTDGRDCDGRHSAEAHYFAEAEALASFISGEGGVPIPRWYLRNSRQRDYTAEAAGY